MFNRNHNLILQLNMFVYLSVEFDFWVLTHVKLPARVQGIFFISGILTYLIVFYTGGLIFY